LSHHIIPQKLHEDPSAFFSAILEDPSYTVDVLWNIACNSYPMESDRIGSDEFTVTARMIQGSWSILIRFPSPVVAGEPVAAIIIEESQKTPVRARYFTIKSGRLAGSQKLCEITPDGTLVYHDEEAEGNFDGEQDYLELAYSKVYSGKAQLKT
jgi:hypothetical protein